MRNIPGLIAFLVLAVPAAAQSDSVTVGGDAAGQTLIDPATGQGRYVPALLQPWQDDAIRLRPPGSHHARKPATTTATTAASTPDTTAALTAVAPPPKKHVRVAAQPTPPADTTAAFADAPPPVKKKPVRTAAVAAEPASEPAPAAAKPAAAKPAAKTAPISGFADIDLITGSKTQAAAKPAAQPAAAPPPVRTASIEKPKPRTASGSRKDSITFAPGASDPSSAALAAVRSLAGTLNNALGEGSRVSLMAYAGARGEKTSDTRRLSLKRALVIRQILIDGGIPAERIDVFALGGADDAGETDRVDVFLKS